MIYLKIQTYLKSLMPTFVKYVVGIIFCHIIFANYSIADNQQANQALETALQYEKQAEFQSAAEEYLAAELYADDPLIKANALKGAAINFRKAKLKHKEFECLERLLNSFPAHVDYEKTVAREYEIGNAFFVGERDNVFSWVPFLEDDDKTIEIYEIALKRGPFSPKAPETRLRLARLYLEKDKLDLALKTLRSIIKMHPDHVARKYAAFELANALHQMAEKGDGDGKYNREAQKIIEKIIVLYPDDPETPWAKETLEKIKGLAARRLYGMAEFYKRQGNEKAAKRYLCEVVADYHDSEVAYDSEEMLANIDQDFKIGAGKDWKPKNDVKYDVSPIPGQQEKLMVAPENSNGKWLLPIKNLRSGRKTNSENIEQEKKGNGPVSDK